MVDTTGKTARKAFDFEARVQRSMRTFGAWQAEADLLTELKHSLKYGEDLVRGEEGSPFDAGFLISRTLSANLQKSTEIIGLEVKTVAFNLRTDDRVNVKNSPFFVAPIKVKPEQALADVWLIRFPFLRDITGESWQALCRPLLRRIPDAKCEVRFQYSSISQKIDHVVPQYLWPAMVTTEDVAEALLTLRTHDSTTRMIQQFSKGTFELPARPSWQPKIRNTVHSVYNQQNLVEHPISRYIQEQLERIPNSRYKIVNPTYRPLTADLCIVDDNGKVAFVEVKIGYCTLLGQTVDGVSVEHRAAHLNHGMAIFTAVGPSWTYLLSFYGTESIKVDGRYVPKDAILVHRDDIPKHWWHSEVEKGSVLRGTLPASCLVELSESVAERIHEVCDHDNELQRFGLPAPDDMRGVSHKYLCELYGPIRSSDSKQEDRRQALDVSRRTEVDYQGTMSLSFLHTCRDLGIGMLYDWQVQEQGLRTYAMCGTQWSMDDITYTTSRPQRVPVQIFQQMQEIPYFLLSFCLIRCHSSQDIVYAAPNAMAGLREAHKSNGFTKGRTIVVMTPVDKLTPFSADTPVYAIPDSALDLDRAPQPVTERKWQEVFMRQGQSFEDYRYDSRYCLIRALVSKLSQGSTYQLNVKTNIKSGLIARSQIYEQISQMPRPYTQVASTHSRPDSDQSDDELVEF